LANEKNEEKMDSIEKTLKEMQQQIYDLQIQFTYQESTIRALDEVIQDQYKEIDVLKQQQRQLMGQIENLKTPSSPTTQYEKPPHY
jgi:uncharacterized coiled-coil protein SlyX